MGQKDSGIFHSLAKAPPFSWSPQQLRMHLFLGVPLVTASTSGLEDCSVEMPYQPPTSITAESEWLQNCIVEGQRL